jgi:prephenate dehydrogenase
MPVSLIVEYLGRIGSLIKPGALVIDLGSTKAAIERAASRLPRSVHFAGCHPLCGSEKSGAAASRKDLYEGALCLITAPRKSLSAQKAARLWRVLGSRVEFISAQEHDRLLAAVSHLPHAISFALTQFIPEAYLAQSAPSLKDLTRIAGSPANVWVDIFLSNKKNIVAALGGYIKILEDFRAAIKAGDDRTLTRLITSVNKKHERFL